MTWSLLLGHSIIFTCLLVRIPLGPRSSLTSDVTGNPGQVRGDGLAVTSLQFLHYLENHLRPFFQWKPNKTLVYDLWSWYKICERWDQILLNSHLYQRQFLTMGGHLCPKKFSLAVFKIRKLWDWNCNPLCSFLRPGISTEPSQTKTKWRPDCIWDP